MPAPTLQHKPLTACSFGAEITLPSPVTASEDLLDQSATLLELLNSKGGLLVIRGMADLKDHPERFLRISQSFGSEVENVRETLTAERFFHDTVPEVMVLSNQPPCNHPPPARPQTARNEDGALVVSYPHQTNWHTDQSYRRPPPDITLLHAITTPPPGQGQTLFADCAAAYDALSAERKTQIKDLKGIHAMSWIGRRKQDVQNGIKPRDLLPHQLPQSQPLVRHHPDTGRASIYLCDSGQMDFVDGPIEGMEPGPNGAGAHLINTLMLHVTHPQFVYVHDWQPGDLVIGDNRCLLHAATWYDADTHARMLWRTTVRGNPGAEYEGEPRSWLPRDGHKMMDGLEHA